MPQFHRRPDWTLPGLRASPGACALDRRRFLASLGAGGLAMAGGLLGCRRSTQADSPPAATSRPVPPGLYPARRNPRYTLDRELTRREAVLRHINYYEFDAANKPLAVQLAQKLSTHPWTVAVTGLVRKARSFGIEELERRFPLEERLYRHRCVETWAMAVPWIGFPLRSLLDLVEPLSSAKYVRFVSFNRPEQAPGMQAGSSYPWPYHEGLRMDEARSELALLATGMYGTTLSKQNGAPLRLVVPWKYGYKSIKAIVEIQLLDRQPPTFWNTVNPREYGFLSNVDPAVPHPRWSQAQEWMIDGDRTEQRPTLKYNGYAALVADLYRA